MADKRTERSPMTTQPAPRSIRGTMMTPASNPPGAPRAMPTAPMMGARKSRMEPARDRIAMRAYQISAAHGYDPRRDVQNWLEAEAQLRAEMGQS